MNTQIEFDADNLFYGSEEDFFRKNKEQFVFNCCDTCIAVANKIKKLKKRIRYLEEENQELRSQIHKIRNDWKESLDELEDIEQVCFKNSNFPIPNNSIAFRIRKRLIEIKLELNNKVETKQKQAGDWQNLAVDMLYFVSLKSRTKLGKSLLKRYHSLINKYPPKPLEGPILSFRDV